MIDSHAHIDSEDFKEDFELMLKRAEEAGVKNIIIPAIEPKRFDDVIEIVNKYPYIYCSMGIHPLVWPV